MRIGSAEDGPACRFEIQPDRLGSGEDDARASVGGWSGKRKSRIRWDWRASTVMKVAAVEALYR